MYKIIIINYKHILILRQSVGIYLKIVKKNTFLNVIFFSLIRSCKNKKIKSVALCQTKTNIIVPNNKIVVYVVAVTLITIKRLQRAAGRGGDCHRRRSCWRDEYWRACVPLFCTFAVTRLLAIHKTTQLVEKKNTKEFIKRKREPRLRQRTRRVYRVCHEETI